jgi:ATP-dependent exoDNAse (exonuclease V) beta subunit
MAGSVDLIALHPDNTADIFDWKSKEVGKDDEELKWFKEPAYRLQLNIYAKILKAYYGIDAINKERLYLSRPSLL